MGAGFLFTISRNSLFWGSFYHGLSVVVKHCCSKGTIIFNKKTPIYLLHKSKLFMKTYMHLILLLKKLKHLPQHILQNWTGSTYRILLHLQRWNLPKCLWVNFRSGGIVFVISLVSCSFVITQSPKNKRKSTIND